MFNFQPKVTKMFLLTTLYAPLHSTKVQMNSLKVLNLMAKINSYNKAVTRPFQKRKSFKIMVTTNVHSHIKTSQCLNRPLFWRSFHPGTPMPFLPAPSNIDEENST